MGVKNLALACKRVVKKMKKKKMKALLDDEYISYMECLILENLLVNDHLHRIVTNGKNLVFL